jgi:lysophospholipase L1-like esterase
MLTNEEGKKQTGQRSWLPWLEWFLWSSGIALLGLELIARVWVAWYWPAEKVFQLTHHTGNRGRFTGQPILGYMLRPNFHSSRFSHNSYGFRGPSFSIEKPSGTLRIVLMGASTVYGVAVGDEETSAVQLENRLHTLLPGRQAEVLNAGVPGWNSRETLMNLRLRVLTLRPDIVVIVDGRNEVFPQLFNNYQEDYSHYRKVGYQFRNSNYTHKLLFRVSHLFMLVATSGRGRLGFSQCEENPAYGSIRYENLPTDDELLQNANDNRRTEIFRHNLEQEIQLASEQNIQVILSTIPFYPKGYSSDVLRGNQRTLPVISNWVAGNNEITRTVARKWRVALVDANATLSQPEFLVDDCHFNPRGEQAFADLILDAIKSIMATHQIFF